MTKKMLPLLLAAGVLLLTGCPQPNETKTSDSKTAEAQHETVTVKGSDTMSEIGRGWAHRKSLQGLGGTSKRNILMRRLSDETLLAGRFCGDPVHRPPRTVTMLTRPPGLSR